MCVCVCVCVCMYACDTVFHFRLLVFFVRTCYCVYCLCAYVFESITEADVLCFGVYVSMYARKVRPGGSEPCLFVIRKGDEELRDKTRVFVSISGKTDGRAKAHRDQNIALTFFSSFDLRGVYRGISFFSFF